MFFRSPITITITVSNLTREIVPIQMMRRLQIFQTKKMNMLDECANEDELMTNKINRF